MAEAGTADGGDAERGFVPVPEKDLLEHAAYLDAMFQWTRISDRCGGHFSALQLIILFLYFPIGLALLIVRLIVLMPLAGIIAFATPRCAHTAIVRCIGFLFFQTCRIFNEHEPHWDP